MIDRGKISDHTLLEHFWHHCYLNELKLDSANHPLVLALSPSTSKLTKEKMTQAFFEGFNVPGIYISESPLLSLYGSGKVNGLIVESGSDLTSVSPIIDGYCLKYAQIISELGGRDLNNHLLTSVKSPNGE